MLSESPGTPAIRVFTWYDTWYVLGATHLSNNTIPGTHQTGLLLYDELRIPDDSVLSSDDKDGHY